MNRLYGPAPRGLIGVRAEGPANVAEVMAKLEKAFTDFKAKNDEALQGKADVVVAEEVNRINAAVTALQTELQAAVKAAAEAQALESRLEALELDADRIRAGGDFRPQRDVRNDAEVFFAGRAGVEAMEVDEAKLAAYSAYADGFVNFLRRGDRLNAVQAAMQVGSDPDGGYWVPTQMSQDIQRRLFETSDIRAIASVLTITTDSIAFPNDTNKGTSGGWVGETASRTTTATPQVGEQRIYVREQYAQPEVTQKLLDMSTIDVEAWLMGKIAEILMLTENTAFVSGSGVNQPRGFLDYSSAAVTTDDASRAWGVLQYVPSGAAGGFPAASGIAGASDPDAIITLISKLKPAYRGGARFVCSRATEAAIRKLKDGDGRYLIGMGDLRDNATGFNLLGYPITTAEDMPALASDSYSLAFGNFAMGYQIVDGRGLRLLRDPYTNKPYVRFYTTKWTGGDVVNFDAIKLMKFASS